MTAFPDPEQIPDIEAESLKEEARDEARGFVLERRRYLAPENNQDLDSIITSSLKRFQKHIASAIKASSKSNREFSLARIDVLEIENLAETSEINLAKGLDSHCKAEICRMLRKSDRLFSNMLGEYLILMPDTPEAFCRKAVARIVEILADTRFEAGPFTLHPSCKITVVGSCVDEGYGDVGGILSAVGFKIASDAQIEESGSSENGKLFRGSLSDWMSRYEFGEEREHWRSVESSKLDLDLVLGRDRWAPARIVALRTLYDPEGKIELSPPTKLALVRFLRQIQGLGNSSVRGSELLDFHIADNRLYLVNVVPAYIKCLSLEPLPCLSGLATVATEPYSIRHVLFRLCGAIAYLKSLVPPITLDRFSNLILLVAEPTEPEAVYLLNHELCPLVEIIREGDRLHKAGDSGDRIHPATVVDFLNYVYRLTSTPDLQKSAEARELAIEVEAILKQVTESPSPALHKDGLHGYNTFSKLKDLFKDRTTVDAQG
ncbi:hypothetical protein GC174_00700 [bacterium]|nr:hypothetical protein [bacterium]